MKANYDPVDLAGTNGALPIRCFTGPDLLPDERAAAQLRHVAGLPELEKYVAVLPDVHYKSRNPSPTGSVVVARDAILPRAVDEGVNCGMRMMTTSVAASEFSPRLLDGLFARLLETIPLKRHERPLVSDADVERVLTHGTAALCDALGLPDDEISRVENAGRMNPELSADEIRASLPPKAIRKGGGSLGTIGAGNHFLELQEVAEILDESTAARLGLHRGQTCFMLHCDGRRLSKKVLRPVYEQVEAELGHQHTASGLWAVSPESAAGKRCLGAMAAASNAGYANRAAVTELVRRALRGVMSDESVDVSLLYDCGHETVQQETYAGQQLWVHRHGASRAQPSSQLSDDPVLGETGQPVPVPGCLGADSYIAVATPGAEQTFYSVAHGAGRTIDKADAAETFDGESVERDVRKRGIRLYRYGADNIAGQAPASFKDARSVVAAMTRYELIQPVARMRPIAVLKG